MNHSEARKILDSTEDQPSALMHEAHRIVYPMAATAELVADAMRRSGVSQADLVRRFGVHRNVVSLFLQGHSGPNTGIVAALLSDHDAVPLLDEVEFSRLILRAQYRGPYEAGREVYLRSLGVLKEAIEREEAGE